VNKDRMKFARPVARLREGRTDWFRIENNAVTSTATVHIYDEIGYWGITAQDFVAELGRVNAVNIDLHISSPGGEIFDGIAIYNCLRGHAAKVTTYVDSLAASIASVIAMAGDEIVMAPHSQLMIHDGSGLSIGNAADMREMAELLDRQSDNIAAVYADRAGGTAEEWRGRMRAETWFTAEEAVDAGLADRVATPVRQGDQDHALAATWDLSIFRYPSRAEAPDHLIDRSLERPAPPEPLQEPEPAAAFDGAAFRAAMRGAFQ
jgi:ATP-dependent protease ClpP protease subunit